MKTELTELYLSAYKRQERAIQANDYETANACERVMDALTEKMTDSEIIYTNQQLT